MGAEHRNNNKNKNKNRKSLSRQSEAELATMARTKAKLAFGSLRAENAKLPTLVRYALGSLVLCLLAFFVFGYALPRTERKKEENVVEGPQEVRVFDYEVVSEYPHDPDAFTQVNCDLKAIRRMIYPYFLELRSFRYEVCWL